MKIRKNKKAKIKRFYCQTCGEWLPPRKQPPVVPSGAKRCPICGAIVVLTFKGNKIVSPAA